MTTTTYDEDVSYNESIPYNGTDARGKTVVPVSRFRKPVVVEPDDEDVLVAWFVNEEI